MEEKFSYKYVRVKLEGGSWTGNFSADYQNVIDEHAEEGWRFVQAFAPAIVGYGSARNIDLIFERKTQESPVIG